MHLPQCFFRVFVTADTQHYSHRSSGWFTWVSFDSVAWATGETTVVIIFKSLLLANPSKPGVIWLISVLSYLLIKQVYDSLFLSSSTLSYLQLLSLHLYLFFFSSKLYISCILCLPLVLSPTSFPPIYHTAIHHAVTHDLSTCVYDIIVYLISAYAVGWAIRKISPGYGLLKQKSNQK